MFPVEVAPHNTMAFMAVPYMPYPNNLTIELQCRLATSVFAKVSNTPDN